MRSTLLIGSLIWAVVCVHSMTRVERPLSIHKRAASPQVFTRPPNSTYSSNNQTQFQWVKVNNQWVRKDGTKLPGYSQANVPYNQSAGQTNTPSRGAVSSQPSGGNSWNTPQGPGNQSVPARRPVQQPTRQTSQQAHSPTQQLPPSRQNSTSQGGLGWNPDADRALTQDLPRTTPRPPVTVATTQRPVVPQTPAPAHTPAAGTAPVQPPFGSGAGVYQKQPPNNRQWNPDASLTYGLQSGQSGQAQRSRPTPSPNTGRSGTNPWGGLFNR